MVGVLLSVGLHVLVVAAFIAMTVGQDGRRTEAVEADASPVMDVALLSVSAPKTAAQHGAPKPPVAEPTPRAANLASTRAAAAPAAIGQPAASSQASAPGRGAPVVATAAAPAAFDPALGEDYRRRLLEHVASYRRPPALPQGERSNGVVLLNLAIDRKGDVLSVSVVASSGVADLDDEAVATVWRARPMPPIPLALPSQLAVTLPVSFDLERSSGAGGG